MLRVFDVAERWPEEDDVTEDSDADIAADEAFLSSERILRCSKRDNLSKGCSP